MSWWARRSVTWDYVQEELAEEGQTVKGVIIALEDDQRIRRALAVVADTSTSTATRSASNW